MDSGPEVLRYFAFFFLQQNNLNSLCIPIIGVGTMDKTFLVDYDDFLAWNLHDYTPPLMHFIEFVVHTGLTKRYAPDVKTIVNTQDEIDNKLVKEMGFCKERFPTSFKNTYRRLWEQYGAPGVPPREDHAEEAYKIGTGFYDFEYFKNQGLIEGASDTLEFLISQHDELLLVTKGEKYVQELKIEATGVRKYFDEVHIVPTKNEQVLREIIGDRTMDSVYMMGNSIRSDINPATAMGLRCVYVPRETWSHEKEHEGLTHPHMVLTLSDIRDIPTHYHLLDTLPKK